jgi:hypothetical protein
MQLAQALAQVERREPTHCTVRQAIDAALSTTHDAVALVARLATLAWHSTAHRAPFGPDLPRGHLERRARVQPLWQLRRAPREQRDSLWRLRQAPESTATGLIAHSDQRVPWVR